ncbi:CorA family divalent cation transporter [Nocardioides yefusunii]|uniref:CorA family divalent cation transporter n=1 Tax=Nocardioides yefusunii TaxID=2500546 RepID=A0ABW1QUG5_9ACTN|nr:CorA family divalent cation transporter [Nocardioides yefusunii]
MEVHERLFVDGQPADVTTRPEDDAPGTSRVHWTWIVGPSEADRDDLLPVLFERAGVEPAATRRLLRATPGGTRRPSLRRHGETVALSLRLLDYDDPTDAVESGEEWVIVRGAQVVSVTRAPEGAELPHPGDALVAHRHGESPFGVGSCLADPEDPDSQACTCVVRTPVDVVHEVLLRCVDDYERVAGQLQEDVDEVELSVFSPSRTGDAERIYTLKREVAEARRAVAPLVGVLEHDVRQDPTLQVWWEHAGALDVVERLHRVSENVDVLDELLSSILDAHVARVSVQQNEDMRRISAGAALVVVPTFLAGVWGMNFDGMPELHWALGYPMALGAMVLSVSGMWVAFRRIGWF